MNRRALLLLLLLAPLPARAQEHLLPQEHFALLSGEYSGERALERVRQLVQHHRVQGSPMMAEAAAQVVVPALRAAGLEVRTETFPSDGRTRYQTHVSPMGWTMRGGELWVEGGARLCRYEDVPMCVSTYSKGGQWSGELVEVGRGTADGDYEGREVRGKVALASGYAASVVRKAVLERGAVGVVIYPAATDRPEHPDLIRYNGIWPRAEELARTSGGFQISANQYARLREQMRKGPVRVRGKIDATLAPGMMTVVHAYLRGGAEPEREVLLTAHLDHPKWSANDNASGSGALLEMARALKVLVAGGKLKLRRTLHFMWVPEFNGTLAYVTRHPEARRCGPWDDPRLRPRPRPLAAPAGREACILANLNLDMVGEDVVKTGARFYATRTLDSVPSLLDAVLADVLEQTREARLYAQSGSRHPWQAELSPYAEGSDHDVLLGLGVPASMFGHAPDWTHHSSEDTIDKLDASELLRVGVMAGAAAIFLGSAGPAEWGRLWPRAAALRLATGGERLGRMLGSAQGAGWQGAVGSLKGRLQADAAALQLPPGPRRLEELLQAGAPAPGAAQRGGGPRRRTLLPLSGSVFDGLAGEERAWVAAQRERLDEGRAGGLAQQQSFDVMVYEAVNLMDGRRGPGDIAELLTAEFLVPIDAPWVERLVGLLSRQGLVRQDFP